MGLSATVGPIVSVPMASNEVVLLSLLNICDDPRDAKVTTAPARTHAIDRSHVPVFLAGRVEKVLWPMMLMPMPLPNWFLQAWTGAELIRRARILGDIIVGLAIGEEVHR